MHHFSIIVVYYTKVDKKQNPAKIPHKYPAQHRHNNNIILPCPYPTDSKSNAQNQNSATSHTQTKKSKNPMITNELKKKKAVAINNDLHLWRPQLAVG